MLMEPEIFALYIVEEPFCSSYFAYLDEYNSLMENYLFFYTALEETLNLESFDTLRKMIEYREKMEEFQSMHHFRQGVLLGNRHPKEKKSIDFPTFH